MRREAKVKLSYVVGGGKAEMGVTKLESAVDCETVIPGLAVLSKVGCWALGDLGKR